MNRTDDLNRTGTLLDGSTPSDAGGPWDDLFDSFSIGTDGGTGEVVAFESSPHSGIGNIARLDAGTNDALADCAYIRIDNQAAAAVRVQDNGDCYFFMATSSGDTSLWLLSGGSFTKLVDGSLTFSPGVGQVLSIGVTSGSITGYVNGSIAATASDATIGSGTKHGIRTSGGFQFLNSIAITDLSGGGGSGVTADASVTLDGVTCSAAAVLPITAAASASLGGVTGSATGVLPITASGSSGLAGATGSAAGTLPIQAAASITLSDVTGSATGGPGVSGDANVTLAGVAGSSTAALPIRAVATITLGGVTGSATAALTITAAASVALAGATGQATGSGGGSRPPGGRVAASVSLVPLIAGRVELVPAVAAKVVLLPLIAARSE